MRRQNVDYRPSALADLNTIFEYIFEASGSSVTAEKFVSSLMERCERIGDAPSGGRRRDDLEPGLRLIAFRKSVVIAYMERNNKVEITNVFYGGRDYEAILRGHSDQDYD